MKFICTVDINVPRNKVVELFQDTDSLGEWQDGFLKHTLLQGTLWQEEALSRYEYVLSKGREIELIETVLVNNLPDEYSAEYAHRHMINTMNNYFVELDENTTRWTAHLHYTQIKGILPKIMAFLFPGMFKMETQKWLDQFKVFAERQ